MKTLIAAIIFLLANQVVSAQKNFEGKITYIASNDREYHKEKQIEVFLKEDKMLLITDGKTNLCDFTKGISYEFIEDSLAVSSDLFENPFPYSAMPDTGNTSIQVLGFNCRKRSSAIHFFQRKYFKSIDNWFSDELIFRINGRKKTVLPPLIFFDSNTIALKTVINFTDELPENGETLIEAKEITAMIFPDSLFTIPAKRKNITRAAYLSNLLRNLKMSDPEISKTLSDVGLEFKLAEVKRTHDLPQPPPSPPSPTAKPHKKKKAAKKS